MRRDRPKRDSPECHVGNGGLELQEGLIIGSERDVRQFSVCIVLHAARRLKPRFEGERTMPHAIYLDLQARFVFNTAAGSGICDALTEGFLRQGAQVAFVGGAFCFSRPTAVAE